MRWPCATFSRASATSASGLSTASDHERGTLSRTRPPSRRCTGTPSALPFRSQSAISTAARAKGLPCTRLAISRLTASIRVASRPMSHGAMSRSIVTATDSDDSSLHVGPPRHAASPHPTRPSAVSTRTKAKLTASSVVKDILCGRFTGMSVRMTRTSAIFIRLLGVDLQLGFGARAAESPGIEERQIQRRLAVEQPFRDVATGRGRVLEAVAAEPDRHEEALDARRPPDDRVIVGRERPEPGPAAGDASVADDGHALDRLLHRLLDLAGVHRYVEVLADVLDVARAQQNLLHLFPEVEAARDVGRERYRPGNRGEGLGEEDVAAAWVHGEIDPRKPCHPRGRGAGGGDHER